MVQEWFVIKQQNDFAEGVYAYSQRNNSTGALRAEQDSTHSSGIGGAEFKAEAIYYTKHLIESLVSAV